jgi:transposase
VAQSYKRKEPVVAKAIRFIGLDVHSETIAVAVADGERGGEIRSLGSIANSPDAVRKLVRRLGPPGGLKACYEAGPTGYVLYWQLAALGVSCDVIAPTLIPRKSGDRVKTDRRDAEMLARLLRSGDLTAVWVPDAFTEALRDLVRAREAAKRDQLRARHRLQKFLLRRGRMRPHSIGAWTLAHLSWIRAQRFEQPAQEATLLDYMNEVDRLHDRIARLEKAIDEALDAAPEVVREVVAALQALRGIKRITAATLAAEVGNFSRFPKPRHVMGYAGIVSSENSTGGSTRRGAITKSGNAHLRRVLIEAAWAYQHRPNRGKELEMRQRGLPPEIIEIAWKAQHRLNKRYLRLLMKGKPKQLIVTAIGRELLGFIWDIAVRTEQRAEGREAA